MKMLPALGKDSSVTENGHYLVRPNGDRYEVVDTVTDEVDSYTNPDTGATLPRLYSIKNNAEVVAVMLAEAALDAVPPQ